MVQGPAPLGGRRARRLAGEVAGVVTEVAARVAAAQARLRPADVERKAVGDFVTTVDLRTERELRRRLLALLPNAGFLGEETAAADLDRELVWVVDPIDGTSNFARGLPHFAVAVALLHNGDPIVAALHCAPENATYTAVRGAGAWRGRRRLAIADVDVDAAAVIGCQWLRGQQRLAFLARLQRRGNRIRTLGSSVTQLADVAAGRLDGNVQQQGKIWDLVAGGLLVEEAGGRFTDWRGRRLFPLRRFDDRDLPNVAAGPRAHRQILRLLAGN